MPKGTNCTPTPLMPPPDGTACWPPEWKLGGPAAHGDQMRLGDDLGDILRAQGLQEAQEAPAVVQHAGQDVGGADVADQRTERGRSDRRPRR